MFASMTDPCQLFENMNRCILVMFILCFVVYVHLVNILFITKNEIS